MGLGLVVWFGRTGFCRVRAQGLVRLLGFEVCSAGIGHKVQGFADFKTLTKALRTP